MVSHSSKIIIFTWLTKLAFSICLMILCMFIPTIIFKGFLTWGLHSHFVKGKYMTRGPTVRNVVCFGSFSHFSPYNGSPPRLCFPFLGQCYTYNRSCSRCGFYVFMIVGGVLNIKAFNAVNEVCILVSIRVGPFYTTFSWLFYSQFRFSYFGCTSGFHIIC